jgi:hypothetical protein
MESKQQYLEMFQKMKQYEENEVKSFPLNKDDDVWYFPTKDKKELGFVDYVTFDRESGEAYARINNRDDCGWISISDKNRFKASEIGIEIGKYEGDECVHRWKQGREVDSHRTFFGGHRDVHEYECTRCGKEKTK